MKTGHNVQYTTQHAYAPMKATPVTVRGFGNKVKFSFRCLAGLFNYINVDTGDKLI